MPRCARIKSIDSIFHIMVRSIDEVPFFKEDEDKKTYLALIRKYQDQYSFKVYGYCLMSNHGHLIIDANGADISKIMHGINFTYAQIFNRRHHRRGCLFQDRFKSKIINDERYIIALSAYIHNNPTDIKGYEKNPEKYEYSSLTVYLGLRKDPYDIVDEDFIMQLFGKTKSRARKNYGKLIALSKDEKILEEVEFKDEKTLYKSCRKILVRNFIIDDIIQYVSKKTNIDKINILMKNSRNTLEARALTVLLMRNLCNCKCSDMCKALGNITQGRVSKLCSIGLKIMNENQKYKNIIIGFIEAYAV